jgi:hypothetical protein
MPPAFWELTRLIAGYEDPGLRQHWMYRLEDAMAGETPEEVQFRLFLIREQLPWKLSTTGRDMDIELNEEQAIRWGRSLIKKLDAVIERGKIVQAP